MRSCHLPAHSEVQISPPPHPTVADVLVARFRAYRADRRTRRTSRTGRRRHAQLRLLAIAAGLTIVQVGLTAMIWTHGHHTAGAVRIVQPQKAAVIEPLKVKELHEAIAPRKVPLLVGHVVRVDRTWECDGPVHLASVTVTMTPAAGAVRRTADAIRLRPGCTGQIGRIDVTQSAGDGIKVAEGVHDLTVHGGTVRCLAKAPKLHQDGVQVMGGSHIRFVKLRIDCGRAGATLVNSNLFIRQGGKSLAPPTDVVCDRCWFGGGAAHTVSVQDSVRSGVTDSTLCPARFPRQMLAVGPAAVDPVTSGNRIGACGGAKAGRKVRVLTNRG